MNRDRRPMVDRVSVVQIQQKRILKYIVLFNIERIILYIGSNNRKRIMRTILRTHEYMSMNDDGQISRKDARNGNVTVNFSDSWRVVGAVERNNFGHVVKFYSLLDILENPDSIPWKFKNGKQKTFIRDMDHGTMREWKDQHRVF